MNTITIDQVIRLMGFPPKAEIQITFCQLWAVPDPATAFDDRIIYLGLLGANEAEAVLTDEQFFQRFIDLTVVTHELVGTTPATALQTVFDGRQVWVDEKFNTLGGVALESVPDGLYLYAQNTSLTDLGLIAIARIHAEILFHQMNWADDYTQDGIHYTEGWAGYEWEESLGAAMQIDGADGAL